MRLWSCEKVHILVGPRGAIEDPRLGVFVAIHGPQLAVGAVHRSVRVTAEHRTPVLLRQVSQ